MKIQTDKHELHRATLRLQGTLVERSLANIALKAQLDHLVMSSADLVLSAFCSLPCEVMEPGEASVPAKIFSEVVRELPDGIVHIEKSGSYLKISAGPSEQFLMKIPLIDNVQWVEKPKIKIREEGNLPSLEFAYMMDQVQFCVSQDSPRNFGTVAYLHQSEAKTWRLVGSDGFRLSYCQKSQDGLSASFLDEGICITKRTLGELGKMCKEGFDSLHLAVAEDRSTLVAEIPNFQIFVRLSSVKYPSYQSVITNKSKFETKIERKLLLEGVRRTMLAADKSRSICLNFREHELEIVSKTLGSSEGREILALDSFSGEIALSINGKYLQDVVSNSTSESLLLKFSGEDAPMVILAIGEPYGCQSLHLFLPIKESSRP
jgi:DNA polymerase-3 subunit beta